ncbi:hypothetical protein BmIO_00001 [Borrelia miyamotoi]|nr:hypothetical protein BmIO_00001 [Borrelia miyamotoi]
MEFSFLELNSIVLMLSERYFDLYGLVIWIRM